jgi:hypothetical protein
MRKKKKHNNIIAEKENKNDALLHISFFFIFPLTLFFIYDIYIFYEPDKNRKDSGNNELILKYRIDMKYLMNFQSAWRPLAAAACLLISQ